MPREMRLDVGEVQFAAQEWGERGQFPVVALHGWLDNSASFFRLAPLIESAQVVAPDMAGHGHSGHRSRFAPYNIWQDVTDVFAIADQMGWDKFALIGHSRGAIISTLAAGTFPDRITHLGLIDGLWPEPVQAVDAPEQLARSILELRRQQNNPPSVFASVAAAIKARENGLFRVSREAATALTERGLKRVPGGYTWSADSLLAVASALKLTQDHIQAFVSRIKAHTKLVLAKEGLLKRFGQYQENLALFPHIEVEVLPGGHHLHMEAEALKIAELFNGLFSR